MPNPYKYTKAELASLVNDWHEASDINYSLEDYIMWETKFSEQEVQYWLRTGELPRA